MLIHHTKFLAFAFSLSLLAACGGGGGSPGTQPPPPPTTGSLAVTIAGLPTGTSAVVKVTGPASFSQTLAATQTLAQLAPGSYGITADSVLAGSVRYTATVPVQSASVAAGATAAATVTYASAALTLRLREVATVGGAVFLTSPPGDPRQFIVTRAGRIRILQAGQLLATPFLDISARVSTGGEGGLLSMAFDPNYASNGYFFVYFTNTAGNIVIERHQVSSDPSLAASNAALEIIRIPHPGYTNHYGGLVSFGTDGMLYLATGDGGGSGDPLGNGQNPNTLLGKLLRLDVSSASNLAPYAVPASNPYVGQAGKRPEIWALGLRNPWRYAFDGANLYIADVGQGRREEVDVVATASAGLNFGWNIMEGTLCYPSGTSCNQSGLTLPVFEYDHGSNDVNGCSITGGYVYRGKALPELAGRYFYSDYCLGFLKSFLYSGGAATEQATWNIGVAGDVQSFGRDADGELYLINSAGQILRMERGPG